MSSVCQRVICWALLGGFAFLGGLPYGNLVQCALHALHAVGGLVRGWDPHVVLGNRCWFVGGGVAHVGRLCCGRLTVFGRGWGEVGGWFGLDVGNRGEVRGALRGDLGELGLVGHLDRSSSTESAPVSAAVFWSELGGSGAAAATAFRSATRCAATSVRWAGR